MLAPRDYLFIRESFIYFYLKGKVIKKDIYTYKNSHPQVHHPNNCYSSGWARQKAGTWDYIWVSHMQAWIQAHEQGAGLQAEQLGPELVPTSDVGTVESDFLCHNVSSPQAIATKALSSWDADSSNYGLLLSQLKMLKYRAREAITGIIWNLDKLIQRCSPLHYL